MTRQALSASFKSGNRSDQGKGTRHGAPREGSKLRAAYDALRRGERIHTRAAGPGAMMQLRDYYGMELRGKRGRSGYIELIGEWDGPYFVPIERILQEDA